VLDSIALPEALLRRDETAMAMILGAGDTRAMASVLASMLAAYLESGLGGPRAALARLAEIRPDPAARPGETMP
jgi:hypothetical protein